MRHHQRLPLPAPGSARSGEWRVIGTLLPYLWAYKGRVVLALLALVAAKVANVGVPVLLNTGAKVNNVAAYLKVADGVIVGSSLKRDGYTWNPVEPGRVEAFMAEVNRARANSRVGS